MTVKIIILIVLGVLFYCGIWAALSVVMIRIYQKNGGFNYLSLVDGPGAVFGIMSCWPVVAIPWFMCKGVEWMTKKMEEESQ